MTQPSNSIEFQTALINWYKEFGRVLPWRETRDPYKIWVSEIILQQTQVKQGWDYYLRFIESFPTVESLATSSDDSLLRVWQGLGYYSRAHNMRHAAQTIVEKYGGKFPDQPEDISQLKGVGAYTTAAISSLAFNLPLAVVDGNVYRVLSRLFGDETPIDTTVGKKHYADIANQLLDRERPALYNQAIMDFGAIICKPTTPLCTECPVGSLCKSNGSHLTRLLPIKSRTTAIKEEVLHFYLLIVGNKIAVEKRAVKGIWKGLYQFPLLESLPSNWKMISSEKLPDHRLTHRLLHIFVHQCIPIDIETPIESTYSFIPIGSHPSYAFPKPLRAYLNRVFPPVSQSYL